MTGLILTDVLDKLLSQHPGATILVDGDTLRGDFAPLIKSDRGKFIFVRDYMGTGTGATDILSPEFVTLRAKELVRPWEDADEYRPEDYEREYAAELRTLANRKGSEIVLVQFDCHVSAIFQLTMQAYIEQLGIADHITRVTFVEQIKHHHSEFICNKFDRIPVAKSHEAYCRLVCQHKPVKISQFRISQTAVKAYLDIHTHDGKLAEYIRTTSSTIDNPFAAAGLFLRDFRRLGLGDFEFLRIAYNTLAKDEKFNEVTKKWKRKLKGRYSVR